MVPSVSLPSFTSTVSSFFPLSLMTESNWLAFFFCEQLCSESFCYRADLVQPQVPTFLPFDLSPCSCGYHSVVIFLWHRFPVDVLSPLIHPTVQSESVFIPSVVISQALAPRSWPGLFHGAGIQFLPFLENPLFLGFFVA